MALFQEKILKKFLVSDEIITEKFQNYLKYKAKAEEIKTFKEEEFQDGFLRDIFESCLDFTLKSTNPKDFNLEREKKNEKDSKKADGAILIDGKVVGIIELKSYKTKNLDEVARQAFWYLSQNSQANFVVISNFDELRFYINKATNYEKFKLFSLDFEEFKKLYTILSLESIKQNLPLKMQNESQEFEQNITKEFYKIFSKFRNELFENLLKNNDESDKIELLNASSKLCDRFIFMLFAKDRNLLPNDIFRQILEEFQNQKFTDFSLYEMFKIYFQAINSGNEKLGIQAYNGGLFASDEFLNELKIDDEILKNNLEKLNSYDFESEISVNILGHIFEQSLSDLEEIESKLNAENFDKTTSKRKKDGVFYTPNFITTFIVENSFGKLCEDKKEEFNLNEILENLKENKEKLTKIEGKKGKIASDERKILELKQEENLQILEKYKTWLLNLKIIDPACGSGAFLNEALEFLIKEHENLKSEMANAGNLFYGENIDISILENNLFGVDINSQAVEIAKLSLWLRTAKKGRKLTKLSDNLKAANSLLEMPFQAESFDIVLGNPPYGAKLLANEEKNYEFKSKESAILFMQLAYFLLKNGAFHSFIIPKAFIFSSTWKNIREKFQNELNILVDCGKAWQEVKLEQVIYSLQKGKNFQFYKNYFTQKEEFIFLENIDKKFCEEFEFLLNKVSQKEIFLAQKIKGNKLSLDDIASFNWGDTFFKEVKKEGDISVLAGANIQKYEIKGNKGFVNANLKISQNAKIKKNSVLLQRIIAHIQNPKDHIKITGTISDNLENYLILNTVQQIILKENFSNKFILALLHSELINYYVYRFIFAKAIRTFQFSNEVLKKIPIINLNENEQEPFILLVDGILASKEKIKNYKILLAEAIENNNFDREIALKKELEKLENLCSKNEKEINSLVYSLYDLSNEEIAIVENS